MKTLQAVFVAGSLIAGWGAPLPAQNEAALKRHFEGKMVTPKLAMPGTEDGIDIYPGTDRPLAYEQYADRLKDNGTALRAGEPVMVTKVRVKSKLIEFQLAGGGYGTLGDETSSNISVPSAPKTKREKNLEGELKREKDSDKKRAIKEELDDLRNAREREDARNRAAVADAEEQRKGNIRQRRLEGGSRFNVRYKDRIPAEALTPAGLEVALAEYVDFGNTGGGPAATSDAKKPGARPDGLPWKGMLLEEADSLFGPPSSTSDRMEGKLKVMKRVYPRKSGSLTAEFVEGVLFRYTLSSE